MVHWINLNWNNGFVNCTQLPLLCEKSELYSNTGMSVCSNCNSTGTRRYNMSAVVPASNSDTNQTSDY